MSLIKLIIMLYCKLFSIKISRTFSMFRITKYNTLSPKKKRQCKQPNTTQLNIYIICYEVNFVYLKQCDRTYVIGVEICSKACTPSMFVYVVLYSA